MTVKAYAVAVRMKSSIHLNRRKAESTWTSGCPRRLWIGLAMLRGCIRLLNMIRGLRESIVEKEAKNMKTICREIASKTIVSLITDPLRKRLLYPKQVRISIHLRKAEETGLRMKG
jgi:hypothetical protein